MHTPSAPRQFLSISDDMFIPGMKKLTDAIHAEGGKAGIQLWQGSLAVGMDQTAQILLASDMEVEPGMTIPGIGIDTIKEVVNSYGKAAKRAVEAGFDCIEFHCAHTYLPHSFLSGGINHRTDEYGGSFENRAKFPLECIRAIRENIPEDMPLFMRIGAQDDDLEGGLTDVYKRQGEVSFSMGVVFYPCDGEIFQELYQNADTALYKVKSTGRGNYGIYKPER